MTKIKTTATEKNVLRWIRMGLLAQYTHSRRPEVSFYDKDGDHFILVKRKVLASLENKGLVETDEGRDYWILTNGGQELANGLE